ncbi:hypothetical protein Spb1_35630 [Planctopirus ephydatiae]|uniref:Uncharacterized protein n=1 Tax=Planctopirus ephydatiae TaxID=2528019 RepID=A0A518GSR0_9PLAN|nr:hypothetical protein Spb1_35630 [Planctopirus ephydatiae]
MTRAGAIRRNFLHPTKHELLVADTSRPAREKWHPCRQTIPGISTWWERGIEEGPVLLSQTSGNNMDFKLAAKHR